MGLYGSKMTAYKGHPPINSDRERLYMVRPIKYMKDAWINRGSGMFDFEQDLKELHADVFVLNNDGDREDKQELCKELGLGYMVFPHVFEIGLPVNGADREFLE